MIRSSKIFTGEANQGKQVRILHFLEEYERVTKLFIDQLWLLPMIPNLLPKELTQSVDSWLSARALQCSGKQASGIVRGTLKKQKQRLFIINQLKHEGKFKQARKLQRIYDETQVTKPTLKQINPELDSRFIKMDFDNETTFDSWVTISSLGGGCSPISIPFKKNKHFNKMVDKGTLKKGIRLSRSGISFMFDIPEAPKVTEGKVLGIDIGETSCLSCSDKQASKPDKHGWDLTNILTKMSRKKKGSKAFKKCQEHRKNYIGWSVNQLSLKGVKRVNRESLHFKGGKSRRLSHWTYSEIFNKLDRTCEELGVQVVQMSPTYTSQRCSKCGWVRKGNRLGKSFKCDKCGFTADADFNASINLSLDLPPILEKERKQGTNRTGFYWYQVYQELIVPDTQRTLIMEGSCKRNCFLLVE